jgi:branched-chain amino acid transport system ATP-binding protein
VRPGEVVTLLGRNGAGKTTTLKSIMGMVGKRTGSANFEGRETVGLDLGPHRTPRRRALPGGARHLRQPERAREPDAAAARRADRRPRARADLHAVPQSERAAGERRRQISGGEQQMLAIARILRTGARFLMLDEPTEGLAPVIIQQIGRTIAELKRRVSRSCWSSRISASPRPWPTAST